MPAAMLPNRTRPAMALRMTLKTDPLFFCIAGALKPDIIAGERY
jgi:hypothetical protein